MWQLYGSHMLQSSINLSFETNPRPCNFVRRCERSFYSLHKCGILMGVICLEDWPIFIFQTYTRPCNFGIHQISSLLHVCEKEREIKGLNFMVWVNLQTLCKCDPRSMSSWMALNDKGKINENLPTQRDVVLVLRVYPYSNSFNISIHSDGCTIPNWDKSHRQPLELRQVCVGTK